MELITTKYAAELNALDLRKGGVEIRFMSTYKYGGELREKVKVMYDAVGIEHMIDFAGHLRTRVLSKKTPTGHVGWYTLAPDTKVAVYGEVE